MTTSAFGGGLGERCGTVPAAAAPGCYDGLTVLTADVRFEGFSTEDWTRLLALAKPQPGSGPGLMRRGMLVLHEGGKVLKAVHTGQGRVDPRRVALVWKPAQGSSTPCRAGGAAALASVARSFAADWVLAMRVGAFDEVMERFGARARREDDLTAQTLKMAECVCEVMDEGGLDLWPSRVRGAFVRTSRLARTALDALCADGHVVALGVFDRNALHTAVLARRRGPAFDLIAGPEVVREVATSSDWRRGLPGLSRAIAQRVGPLSLGCFGELSAVRALLGGMPPGSLVRAVVARDIVLSPPTLVAGAALGMDAVRALIGGLRRASERVAVLVTAVRWLDAAVARVAGHEGGASLGLDPVSALRVLLAR